MTHQSPSNSWSLSSIVVSVVSRIFYRVPTLALQLFLGRTDTIKLMITYSAVPGGSKNRIPLKRSRFQIINANVRNRSGDTPVHLAAWKGHADIIRTLRTMSNADPKIQNDEGKTPMALVTDPEAKNELQHWLRNQEIETGDRNEDAGKGKGDFGEKDYEPSDDEQDEK